MRKSFLQQKTSAPEGTDVPAKESGRLKRFLPEGRVK